MQDMILVSKEKFFSIIGPINHSTHKATGKYINDKWVDSWELKTEFEELVGRNVGNKYYINKRYIKDCEAQ